MASILKGPGAFVSTRACVCVSVRAYGRATCAPTTTFRSHAVPRRPARDPPSIIERKRVSIFSGHGVPREISQARLSLAQPRVHTSPLKARVSRGRNTESDVSGMSGPQRLFTCPRNCRGRSLAVGFVGHASVYELRNASTDCFAIVANDRCESTFEAS